MRKAYLILCLILSIVFVLTAPSQVNAATPTVTLSPTSGYTDTAVTIQGVNLPISTTSTGYTVTFRWDGGNLTTSPSPIIVGKTGSFSTTFTVPSDATVGVHNVTATVYVPSLLVRGTTAVTATSQFTVLQRLLIKQINPILPIIPIAPTLIVIASSPTPTVSPSPSTVTLASPVTGIRPPPLQFNPDIIGALVITPSPSVIVTPTTAAPAAPSPPPAVVGAEAVTPSPSVIITPTTAAPVAPPAPAAANPPSNQSSGAPGAATNTPAAASTPTPSLLVANPLAPMNQLSLGTPINPVPSIQADAKAESSSSGFPIVAVGAVLVIIVVLALVLKKLVLG